LILALLLAACGSLGEAPDETAGWSAQKIYAEAKDALQSGTYERAVTLFEKLEARYPFGRYAQQAQLEIAYAYYKSGETVSAIAACDRFIKLHPNHPSVDYAYYLKGVVNFNDDLGYFGQISRQDPTERDSRAAKESFDAFRELVVKFPDSRYADDARSRMAYLINAMAANDVHVARYYMKRKAYLAAVNRAQAVVKTYPQAPAVEDALIIMVLGYDALGLTDLKKDAERVLLKNFPQATLSLDRAQKAKPWWQLW
jgi:outer membrane protein assembly factor BamD